MESVKWEHGGLMGEEGMSGVGLIGLYAFEWGELVRILGGFGREGQVTPPA